MDKKKPQTYYPNHHDYCHQEQRITRLEERQNDDRNLLKELKESINQLSKKITELNVSLSQNEGRSKEQDFIKGYIISFIISIGIIIITHLFRL